MTEQQISANGLWLELYASVFARSQHETLWKAMAALPDEEKFAIDEQAVAIITRYMEGNHA